MDTSSTSPFTLEPCKTQDAPPAESFRLLDQLSYTVSGDGIFVEGLEEPIAIQGILAQTILPVIIDDLKDGTDLRSLLQKHKELPVSYLVQAVEELTEWGMLVSTRYGHNESSMEEQFYMRLRAAMGKTSNGILPTLLYPEICVVFHDSCRLLKSGLAPLLPTTSLTFFPSAEFDPRCVPENPNQLLCFVNCFPENASQIGEDTHYYRVLKDIDRLELGPLFTGRGICCHRCFSAMYSTADAPGQVSQSSSFDILSVGLLAAELARVRVRASDHREIRSFLRYSIGYEHAERMRYSLLPFCSHSQSDTIRTNEKRSSHVTALPVVYEDYIATSGVGLHPIAPGMKSSDDMSDAMGPPALVDARSIALPIEKFVAGMRLTSVAPEEGSPELLTVSQLAVLLGLTCGYREQRENRRFRWNASAGNFGSPQAYLLCKGIEGLNDGTYCYDPDEHRLLQLSTKSDCLRMTDCTDDVAACKCLVIFVGARYRVSEKYRSFSYRLLNLDAGVALGQLLIAAASSGIRARRVETCDAQLIRETLGLRPGQELVTALVALGCTRIHKSGNPIAPNANRLGVEPVSLWKPASAYAATSVEELEKALYRPEHSLNSKRGATRSNRRAWVRRMELMMHPSVTVAEVLYDRRSVREFIKKSIPRNTLEAVLTYSARWADPGTRVGDDVAIHVLAKDVGGMDKTLYSYCPDEGVLKARTDEIPPSNIARLLNAAVEGDPSVVVIFTGRLVAAVEKDGLCGYQRLFVDAGVTAHRMWLSAISFGLRGVPIAGIVRSEARAQLGLDDYHDLPLLALVLGYAKEAR